jgi:hypothetical protein
MVGADGSPDPIATLVAAIEQLGADLLPHSPGLRAAWPAVGRQWIAPWAVELGRDLGLASESLDAAAEAGPGPDGVAHAEVALWRFAAARELFHAVVALVLGVPALRLTKRKKGIQRFEPDPRANRARLRDLARDHPVADDVLALDEALARHRFIRLRHQRTHSLAPILEWRALVWFEVAELERGSVMRYDGSSLEPAHELQGAIRRDQLFERTVADGREVVKMLTAAVRKLAELVGSVGVLAPPEVVWRAGETGELFLDRQKASEASRAAFEAGGEAAD